MRWIPIGAFLLLVAGAVACGGESDGRDGVGASSASATASGAGASGSGSGAGTGSGASGSGGGSAGGIGDPDYKEGFGKDATGGEGKRMYVVTTSAETGPGSFFDAFPGGSASDVTIVFSVPTVTLPDVVYVGSNVTIDGIANGNGGVVLDATAPTSHGLVVEDPASNIVVRGINFQSAGTPDSGFPELDLLAFDGTNGAEISRVLVDWCTFVQASDGALDITGNVSDVTVQRSLFYGTAKTMLVKYGTRQRISVHHNVLAHNGERNPQVKGDMTLFDFVNNVVLTNDVPTYADGTETAPYGTRFWSCGAGCDSEGDVVANAVGNVYSGPGTAIELIEDTGGSNAGVYLGDNACSPPSNCPASPAAAPNAIPPEHAVTTLPAAELGSMLDAIGAPNRTALDQQRLDEAASSL